MKNILSIAILLLALLMSCLNTAQAATITVNASDGSLDNTDGLCSISEAIINANDDAATHIDCVAGSGADTLNLSTDITISSEFENDASYGRIGTPAITTAITINGKGFTLQRLASLGCNTDGTSDVGEFRLLRSTSATSNLQLINLNIVNGCADGTGNKASGGGLINIAPLSLNKVTFKDNTARLDGGGLFGRNAQVLISNSLFVGNSAVGSGGGFYSTINDSNIENSTFSANSANLGAGIYFTDIMGPSPTVTINNVTFANNTAIQQGGAIYNNTLSTSINLNNSLFYANGSNECVDKFASSLILGSNNLSEQSSANSGCPGLIASTLTASSIAPLSDNGGATLTHALLPGSEAINNGDINATTRDQRGFSANGIRDIGAFELTVLDTCPLSLKSDGFTTTVSTAAELIQAMECSNVNGSTLLDTINFGSNIILTQDYQDDATYGLTGTPTIKTNMLLDGKGFVLERDATTSNLFRLILVRSNSDTTIKNIKLLNGKVDGIGEKGFGGAINNRSTLELNSVILQQNNALKGGAVYSRRKLTLKNSILMQNSATQGGGLYNLNTINSFNVSNTLFRQNSSSMHGSDIYIYNISGMLITDSTFVDSSYSGIGGSGSSIYLDFSTGSKFRNITFSNTQGTSILLDSGLIRTIINSTFIGSTTAVTSVRATDQIVYFTNNIFKNTVPCANISPREVANNLSESNTGCGGWPIIGNGVSVNNISTLLTGHSCTTPLADGTCLPVYALLLGSNAINGASMAFSDYYTTQDARGFAAEGVRDIGAFETQTPVVTAPADNTFEATGALTSPALGVATVTDVDEPALSATPNPTSFALGIHTVTWTATDSQGFVGSDTQQVTIVDTTAPIITPPADIVIEATGATTPVTLGTATANDLVDGAIAPVTADMSSPFTLAMHTVTWSATDNSGNTGTATQLVNVQAVISGNITGLNGSITLQNNNTDDLTISVDGNFRFATALDNTSNYAITVLTQPATQTCSVSNPNGQINGANISNIALSCVDNALSFDTTSLDLGLQFVGDSSTQTVTLTNTGSGDIIISALTNPPAPFSIIGGSCFALPMTLMATQSCDIIIEFNPNSEGSFNGSFEITSNIPASPTVINLLGSSAIRIIPTLSFYGLLLMITMFLSIVYTRKIIQR